MMRPGSRREFLADVARGMLISGIGLNVACDLELATASAAEGNARNENVDLLTFGDREPLVRLLQETPSDKLLPLLVNRWKEGTTLKELVAAAALANARTFGGEDYIGFHTMMALVPALQMSQRLTPKLSPLPILKVLYRNTQRIHDHGGASSEILHP
ncbi:MAG: hypothetical protein FJ267_17550, partial [Planctomycetes bacterium]|nr:hypothetical protein [Planctomycetota bacterium]